MSGLGIDPVRVWAPYRKQAEFLSSAARYNYFCAGRGAGKSWTLALDVLLRGLANGPVRSAMFGRSQGEVERVLLPRLVAHAEALREATGFKAIGQIHRGDAYLEWATGGSLWYRGYERIDKLRGEEYAHIALDEVCWSEVSATKVWETLMPAQRIAAPRWGMSLASSPNGMSGITRLFRDMQDAENPDFRVARATSYDNPHLPAGTIDVWKASMSKAAFQQEILALALRPSSVVYSQFDPLRHVIDYDWRTSPPGSQWAVGVDWGVSHAAAVLIRVEPSGRWVIVDELIDEPQSYSQYREKLIPWVEGYSGRDGPTLAAGDRAVPSEQRKLLQRWGSKQTVLGADTRADQSVRDGIGEVQAMLDPAEGEPRLYLSSRVRRQTIGTTAGIVEALENYRWRLNADGVPTDQALKDDRHDHIMDSLRYAVVCSRNMPLLHGGAKSSVTSAHGGGTMDVRPAWPRRRR